MATVGEEEDMPEEDGALVAGAVGAGGGFIFGVVDGGRTVVVEAIFVCWLLFSEQRNLSLSS